MTQIFSSGERAQDLIAWAKKLDCLGGVLEALGHTNEQEMLGWYAGGVGSIIRDYAQAIEAVLSAVSYDDLLEVIGEYESPALAKINADFMQIKDLGPSRYRDQQIKDSLFEIEQVKETVSFVFDIERELKRMQGDDGLAERHPEKMG